MSDCCTEEGIANERSVDETIQNEEDIAEDEAMFSLLFSQCEKDNTGWAVVDDLVEYIRKMLDSADTRYSPVKEDVYDPDGSVQKVNYNLDLLRHMLNTYAVDGTINLVTYNYVIGKWVKDVRSRSPSPIILGTSRNHSEEPDESILSHSSVTSLLHESYETSGADVQYSNHEMDPNQMKSTISELQLEAKRLKDRNDQLLLQMESSEENMRLLQMENSELNVKIKSQVQCLGQMESVREDNMELASRLVEGEKICADLREKIDNLQQELQELQSEISHLQNQLILASKERDDLYSETQTLQNTLGLREDAIRQLEEEKLVIENRLEDQHHETQTLHNHLKSTNETVEELKQENSSLQHQINENKRFPTSSTPFKPSAPSLHEELANSDIPIGMSPLLLLNSSINHAIDSIDQNKKVNEDDEDVLKKIATAKAKFEEKAKLIDDGLSELIDTPLVTVHVDKSTNNGEGMNSINSSEGYRDLESSIHKIKARKKREMRRTEKMSDELKKAKEENKILRNRVDEMIRQMKSTKNAPIAMQTPVEPEQKLEQLSEQQEPVVVSFVDTISSKNTGTTSSFSISTCTSSEMHSVATGHRKDESIPSKRNNSITDSMKVDEHNLSIKSFDFGTHTDPPRKGIDTKQTPSNTLPSTVLKDSAYSTLKETNSPPELLTIGGGALYSVDVSSHSSPTSKVLVTVNKPKSSGLVSQASVNVIAQSDKLPELQGVPGCELNTFPLKGNFDNVGTHTSATESVSDNITSHPVRSELQLKDSIVHAVAVPSCKDLSFSCTREATLEESSALLAVTNVIPSIDKHLLKSSENDISTNEDAHFHVSPLNELSILHEDQTPSDDQYDALQKEITQLKQDSKGTSSTDPPQSACLSSCGQLIWHTIQASVLLTLFLGFLFLLLMIMVGLSSILSRCGGRVCNQSPLHMFFGQNLHYSHSEEILV